MAATRPKGRCVHSAAEGSGAKGRHGGLALGGARGRSRQGRALQQGAFPARRGWQAARQRGGRAAALTSQDCRVGGKDM